MASKLVVDGEPRNTPATAAVHMMGVLQPINAGKTNRLRNVVTTAEGRTKAAWERDNKLTDILNTLKEKRMKEKKKEEQLESDIRTDKLGENMDAYLQTDNLMMSKPSRVHKGGTVAKKGVEATSHSRPTNTNIFPDEKRVGWRNRVP